MSFTGDATHIPISNIVQALFMNGQEGVLSLQDGARSFNVRLLKEGIRLLAGSADDLELLKSAVVKAQLLTEAEFQNTLSTRDASSKHPGDFFIRRRLVTAEDVEEKLCQQFEEKIFEIFAIPNLHYEFRAQESWDDHEFFDPEGAGQMLIFSVNGVLMESVRREDDWLRIREAIPSTNDIIAPCGKTLPPARPDDIECDDDKYDCIRRLVTGERTVERIVDESPYSVYAVSHLLFQLVNTQRARCLDVPEKQELADKLRRTMKYKEAATIYRSLLGTDSDDARIRLQIVGLLERIAPESSELDEHYRELAATYETSEPAKALEYLAKIIKHDSSDLDAYEATFRINENTGRTDEANAIVRSLVRQFKAKENPDRAIDSITRLLEVRPGDPVLLQELADQLQASGDDEGALQRLKTLAQVHEERGDIQRLRKVCQLIIELSPKEAGRYRKLLNDKANEGKRLSGGLKVACIALIACGGLGLALHFGLGQATYKTALADVSHSIKKNLEHEAFDTAKACLADFEQAFPQAVESNELAQLQSRIANAERRTVASAKSQAEQVCLDVSSNLARARSLIKKNNEKGALDLLRSAAQELKGAEIPDNCKGTFKAIVEEHKRLATRHRLANQYLQKAESAEKSREFGKAHEILRVLIDKYPNSEAGSSAKLPVIIHARPDDAEILINDHRIGTGTPMIAKLNPNRPVILEIRRRGYHSKRLELNPMTQPEVVASLDRQSEWVMATNGPIEAAPAIYMDKLFVANRNGEVIQASLDGKIQARFLVPDKVDIAGGLGVWNNVVFAGSFDGRVYFIDGNTGSGTGKYVQATSQAYPIKAAPSVPSQSGNVVFNCGGRTLVCIDISNARIVWSKDSASKILGTPFSDGATIFAFCENGEILRFGHDDGTPTGRLNLDGQLRLPGSVQDGHAVATTETNESVCIRLSDGQVLWRAKLGSAPTAAPTISWGDKSVLIPLEEEELVCLDTKDGAVRWTSETKGQIRSQGTVFINRFYVGTTKGLLTCHSLERGRLEWVYSTAGAAESPARPILCEGTVSRGRLYQGSDDGRIYSILISR